MQFIFIYAMFREYNNRFSMFIQTQFTITTLNRFIIAIWAFNKSNAINISTLFTHGFSNNNTGSICAKESQEKLFS